MSDVEDRISPVFNDRIILITGGTGFMGKVLVEKLLRCCPKLGQLYFLIRTKKGKSPEERLTELFSNPIFDQVKEARGLDTLVKQCRVIGGDCMAEDLGLSEEDRNLIINNVSFIYHCAATIRFDEHLKKAVLLNTRGTRDILKLAKECKKLDLFAYMSTSYCHLHEKLLLEKPYDPPADPHKIIKAIECLDEDEVEAMTLKILGDIPNTYAYTKALAESLVNDARYDLPTLILRPSIVIPTWKEPLPGWTDNINGPTGLLIGAGKGVIRTMYCNPTSYGDFVPVDLAVNAVFVSTWNFVANKDTERRIINFVSSAEIKVSWQEIIEVGQEIVNTKLPLNGVLWYPGGGFTRSRMVYRIKALLYHWIPAVILDCLLFCLGYPPVLCKVHRRIAKGFEVLEYYACNQWDFSNEGVLYLRSKINAVETKKYKIDAVGVEIKDYFEDCIRAARLYILKETDETLPAARRHMKIMYCVDKICKTLITVGFIYWMTGLFLSIFFEKETVDNIYASFRNLLGNIF